MDSDSRLLALLGLWSWIPAFRAVAETEHLPSAARQLGVVPSSLSRAIAQLERACGKPLFRRTGRSLQLNDDGRRLLTAVRDAMRRLDDGVQDLGGAEPRGPLRVASSGAATTAFVAPALAELRRKHVRLLPELHTRGAGEVAKDLLRGRLDVSFQEVAVAADGLITTPLGAIARGIYCGRRHPLFAKQRVTANDLEQAEFVVPPADEQGVSADGWPIERPRRVGMVVDLLRVGLEVCRLLPLLAVLPDVLVAASPTGLRRLPSNLVPPSRLFATHRRVLAAKPTLALQLVESVRERMQAR